MKYIPVKNDKGRKLYRVTNKKTKRHNKKLDLYLKHPKSFYIYWYKFLENCVIEGHKINKNFYMKHGWDIDKTIMKSMKFDEFWDKYSVKLFTTKTMKEDDQPRFKSNSKAPDIESLRMTYLVHLYEKKMIKDKGKSNYKGINYDIVRAIINRESVNRYLTHANVKWVTFYEPNEPQFDRSKNYNIKKINLGRPLTKSVSTHKDRYKDIIKNICKGVYPS